MAKTEILYGNQVDMSSPLGTALVQYRKDYGVNPPQSAFSKMRNYTASASTKPQVKPSASTVKALDVFGLTKAEPKAIATPKTSRVQSMRSATKSEKARYTEEDAQNADANGGISKVVTNALSPVMRGPGLKLGEQLGDLGESFATMFDAPVSGIPLPGGPKGWQDKRKYEKAKPAIGLTAIGSGVGALGAVAPAAIPFVEAGFGAQGAHGLYKRATGEAPGVNEDPLGVLFDLGMLGAGAKGIKRIAGVARPRPVAPEPVTPQPPPTVGMPTVRRAESPIAPRESAPLVGSEKPQPIPVRKVAPVAATKVDAPIDPTKFLREFPVQPEPVPARDASVFVKSNGNVRTPEPTTPNNTPNIEAATPKVEAPNVEAPKAKEPWEMTRDEFAIDTIRKEHDRLDRHVAPGEAAKSRKAAERRISAGNLGLTIDGKPTEWAGIVDARRMQTVQQALSEGKPVPPEVLADYPDLAPTDAIKPTETPSVNGNGNGKAPKVEPVAPVEAPKAERTVRMNLDSNNAIRESYGLEPLGDIAPELVKHNADMVAEATRLGLKDKAIEYTKKAADNERSLTPQETAGVVQKAAELDKAIAKAIESGDRAKANALQAEFDGLSKDFRRTGTVPAQELQARKLAVKAEDYTYATAKQAKAENLGRPPTEKESIKVEEAVRQLNEAKAQTAQAEAENAKLVAENERLKAAKAIKKESINRLAGASVEKVRAYRADAIKEFHQLTGQLNAGLDPQALYVLGKIAKSYVQEGAISLDAVVKRVMVDVKGVTEADIIQALNAPNPTRKQPSANAQAMRGVKIEATRADLETQLKTGDVRPPLVKPKAVTGGALELNQIAIRKARAEIRQVIEQGKPIKANLEGVGQVYDIGNNVLRTSKATADLSSTLRQGLILVARDLSRGPKGAANLSSKFFKSLDATIRGGSFDRLQNSMVHDPRFGEFQRAGGHFSEIGGGGKLGEELYIRGLGERLPVVKQIIAGSERHMVSFLNLMRTDAFYKFMDAYPDATPAELKGMADLVNVFSGRGNLGRLGAISKGLGRVFFAPRFAMSRIEAPFTPIKYKDMPRVRNEAIKSIASTAALGASVMTMAKLAGAEVTSDPKSSDWGKIKVGDTRFDVWAGMQQPTRLLMQSLMYGDFDAVSGTQRFISYKLAPGITTPLELRRGRTITGQETTAGKTVSQMFIPIAWTDIYDAYKGGGTGRAALAGTATLLGIGSSTYSNSGSSPAVRPARRRVRARKG